MLKILSFFQTFLGGFIMGCIILTSYLINPVLGIILGTSVVLEYLIAKAIKIKTMKVIEEALTNMEEDFYRGKFH